MNGYADKEPLIGTKQQTVRTFCIKKEYESFLLVSKNILDKIIHEDEVEGFALQCAFDKPYPVYAVALNTTKIEGLLKKYKIDGAWNK